MVITWGPFIAISKVVVPLESTGTSAPPSKDHEVTRVPETALLLHIAWMLTTAIEPAAYSPEPVDGQSPVIERG